MKKIKFLIASMIGAIALVFACVLGTKVNATSYEIGSATVTTTTNSGDTKTWDFKVSSATTLSNGDDVNGVVVYGGWNVSSQNNKTKVAAPSIKKDNGGLDFYWKGYVLVPVISSNSSGKINIGLTSNNNQRYLQLIDNTGTVSSYGITASTMSFDFDEDDVWTIGDNHYVKVMSAIVSTKSDYSTLVTCEEGQELTVTCGTSGEIKMGSVQVVLDNETYGSAAILHTVTYMDGTTTLKTDAEAVDGSNISYAPKKYGYDFEGWYTESTLDNKISDSYTVTDDVTLYANWTAWTNTGIEEYTLSNAAIEKIATGIDGNLSSDLALTPSIYTAMSGVGMTTTNVALPGESSATQAPCFNTNGAVKTNGNGLKFTAPTNGTLTAYVGAGGGSQRNIKLTDGTNVLEPTTGSVVVGNIESARYTPVEIVYTLEEGTTYYFGGDNGVRIYYISFEEAAPAVSTPILEQQESADGSSIRYIATIVTEDTDSIVSWNATYTLEGQTDFTTADFTTLYKAVAGTNGKAAATNTYYLVVTLKNIPSNYNGKELTCTINVKLEGGQTISSNTKTYTLNVA